LSALVGSPSILDDLDAYEARDSAAIVVEAVHGALRTDQGTHWAAVGAPRSGTVHASSGADVRWWVPLVMPVAGGG